ncbi:MAG: Asp-tRNA(Asn)/Glu-tRNA(Gln) amidotransferase subunit GatC [bacterium]
MTKKQLVTTDDVKHLAKLANLPLSDDRLKKLVGQIETTFEYIQTLEKTNTDKLTETNQVTGLTNVMREDVVDSSRTLTQAQALQNAKHTHNGYFVVPAIFNSEDN